MARASGSYPEGRWFDSTRRYHFFIKSREFSSAGRASALQAEGHRFEPYNSHHHRGLVVQLVRMPACHAGGRRFEPVPGRQLNIFDLKRLNVILWHIIYLVKMQEIAGIFTGRQRKTSMFTGKPAWWVSSSG